MMRDEDFFNPPDDDIDELDEQSEQEAFMEASRIEDCLANQVEFVNFQMVPRVKKAIEVVNSLIAKECRYADEMPDVTITMLGTTCDVVYTIKEFGLVIKQDTLKQIADIVAGTECVISIQPCDDATTRLSFSYKKLKIITEY